MKHFEELFFVRFFFCIFRDIFFTRGPGRFSVLPGKILVGGPDLTLSFNCQNFAQAGPQLKFPFSIRR